MAEVKILDLDAMVADEPESRVKWKNEEHAVLGLTVETYLRAQQLQRLAQDKGRSEDEQFGANLDFLFALVPSLIDRRHELLRLKLPAMQKLLEFVLEAAGFTTATGAAEAVAPPTGEPETADPGESQPPA